MDFSVQLLEFYHEVLKKPQNISLLKLLEISNLNSEGMLTSIQELQKRLDSLKLEVIPSIEIGLAEDVRIVKQKQENSFFDLSFLKKLIEEGENSKAEFKSSLLFDFKREKHDKSATNKDLRSDEVLHSSLKSIAGFLNWDGGYLVIGINDNGELIGIEKDLSLFPEEKRSYDQWELELRNQINGKFENGNTVNQYIEIHKLNIDGKTIVLLKVLSRIKLSFLKKNQKEDYLLYIRQGNSSRQVLINEVEEFLHIRSTTIGIN